MIKEIGENPNDYMGKMDFVWWHGVVEDINDPLFLGRVRVRVYGFHTNDKLLIPTSSLPWAMVMQPITSAAMSGKGRSPTGILPGSWVIGFFRDGPHAQDPIVIGTVAGWPFPDPNTNEYKDKNLGFYDPSGKYPLDDYLGEQDTHRLARGVTGEELKKTIVKDKVESAIVKIPTGITGEWKEPLTSYGATYPHNHVYESESGHIFEVDDTPGKERLHRYHKSGSFEEVHPDGSRVTKIIGNDYEITIGSKSAVIKGDVLYTNEGKAKFKVGKDFYLEVDGDVRTLVHGNVIMHTKGSFVHRVSGSYTLASGGNMTFVAPRIDLNPEGLNPQTVSVGGLDKIQKRRVEFPDPNNPSQTTSLASLPAASLSGVIAGNTKENSVLQQQAAGTISQGAIAQSEVVTSAASSSTAIPDEVGGSIASASGESNASAASGGSIVSTSTTTSTNATVTALNGKSVPAIPPEVGGVRYLGNTTIQLPRIPETIGQIALLAAAAGAAAAAAFQDESDTQQAATNQPVAAVALPPLPPPAPGVQDTRVVMGSGGTGAAQEATGLPGLPTVSLYAVPGEAATLLQGYPGQTGIGNTDPTSDMPVVTPLPSVPVLAFPAEFAQPVILPDVLDGGAF